MDNNNRTFLLGAGFSKAVSDGPLMKELWSRIENVYKKEKNKSIQTNRTKWFKELNRFVNLLEHNAKNNLPLEEDVKIKGGIKDNIEYLYTLIDLHTKGAPKFKFIKEGVDIEPYSVIPFNCYTKNELEEMQSILATYLYTIFTNLEIKKNILNEFCSHLKNSDNIITFNYDLVLEKVLWNKELWSPLGGYVGVDQFKRKEDYKALKQNNRFSKLSLHKLHGSISWEYSFNKSKIYVTLEDKENSTFYYEGLEKILGKSSIDFSEYDGYAGKYNPAWVFPSFIKPFNRSEIFAIWQSASQVLKNTEKLIIIGYSFRPEDNNAQLLLTNLNKNCEITLVDPYPQPIIDRLKELNININHKYKSLRKYLSK